MFKEDVSKATGKLTIEIKNEAGKVIDHREVNNLVVDTGLAYIAGRMKDATATAMSHMGIGTGAVAAAAGDTTLGTEAARVALTSTTVTANAVAYVASFAAGTGTGAVTEAGILNASSSGVLLCRTVFSVVNKAVTDSMTITWTVTIS
jgi:uncharacterized membrane protein|tara:strand:+ start:7222 stop:7665 length:444 start_codon:yes stop_codon:yes gene_type:complete